MKLLSSALSFIIAISGLHGSEDHLVLVPTPVVFAGACAEHTVIEVPYVSGYGLDFIGYCYRIASPYMADVHSPATKDEEIDINPLSYSGLIIDAQERHDSNVHIVTFDFSAVKGAVDQIELLKAATKCVYRFGDSCMTPFKTDILLKGVAKESSLHDELSKILATRKSSQDRPKN